MDIVSNAISNIIPARQDFMSAREQNIELSDIVATELNEDMEANAVNFAESKKELLHLGDIAGFVITPENQIKIPRLKQILK